jgi:uroporphyrinogen-III decarboxylase
MSSIERVQAAIDLRKPDRVPVDLHNFQPAAFNTGLPMSEVFKNGDLLAQSMLDAWREFGHDMILLENGTACNAQACGVEVIYRDDAAPATHKALVDKLEDVADLEVPDPYCARADQGPMDLSAQLRGMSELMLDIALDEQPKLIHALLDYSRRVATRYAYALIRCGGHSTSIGEPIAGPELLSPKHYRQYPWVHEKRMVDELKEHGIILHNHICGNTSRILDEFIATGAQVLEVDHKTDPVEIKDAARHKTCLLGNIDTGLLQTGTPEEVDEACRQLIEVWKPDSGFILGPGCAMGATVPADNIHALVESAKKYGVYN